MTVTSVFCLKHLIINKMYLLISCSENDTFPRNIRSYSTEKHLPSFIGKRDQSCCFNNAKYVIFTSLSHMKELAHRFSYTPVESESCCVWLSSPDEYCQRVEPAEICRPHRVWVCVSTVFQCVCVCVFVWLHRTFSWLMECEGIMLIQFITRARWHSHYAGWVWGCVLMSVCVLAKLLPHRDRWMEMAALRRRPSLFVLCARCKHGRELSPRPLSNLIQTTSESREVSRGKKPVWTEKGGITA